jgi:hypothetical protein
VITVEDIVEAINARLVEAFPEDMVYENLLPKDFSRPSTLIELASVQGTQTSRWTIEVKASFSLTSYVEVGGHYESDTKELRVRQNRVMGLFANGYLQVGDRCLEVQVVSGGMDFTESYVDLEFQYFDDRPDISETLPLMETIKTKLTMEG